MRLRCVKVVPMLLAAALAAAPAAPQVEAQEVRVVPQAGLYLPVNDYGELRNGTDEVVELGRKSATLAVGVAGELTPSSLPMGIRVTLMHGTDSPVPYVSEDDSPGSRARGNLLVATGTAAFRPIPRLLVAEPYLLVGGGIRRFGFDTEELADPEVLRDQTRGVAHLGGGVDVTLGSLSLVVEVGSVVGRFEPGERPGTPDGREGDPRTMTDLFVTTGLSFGM